VLVLTLFVAGQVSAFAWPTMPAIPVVSMSKQQVLGVILVSMWIRLQTKGTSFDYKASDWSDDVKDVMSSLNIFDSALYAKLVKMFDKWMVGRRLAILDSNTRTREEDGRIVTVKDKKLKCVAFGAMGLFDAYVISMLDKIGAIGVNFDKMQQFTTGAFDLDFGFRLSKPAAK
jgi:hypothetical protein